MSFILTNGELDDFIIQHGDLKYRSINLQAKFRNVAKKLKDENRLISDVNVLQQLLRKICEVKVKDDEWRRRERVFEIQSDEQVKKRGRPRSHSHLLLPKKFG